MKRSLRAYLASACMLALLLAFAPLSAHARDYGVASVDIDATLEADGSLEVVERRTYDFDGSFNGIYWDLPSGEYEGRAVEAQLESVRVVGDAETVFEESDSGEPGTYGLSEGEGCLQLKLLWPVDDESVTFEVAYRLSDVATRWADVGELYWQYVPADESSGKEWQNVACTIHLPVPSGERVVPGENVRAWAHGPLDGDVSFKGDDVVFFSPGVGYSEYLEARVTLPCEWLSEASPSSEARLDAILEEEAAWADEANAQRFRAKLAYWGLPIFMVVLAVGSAAAAFMYIKGVFVRREKSTFKERYLRDVPTDDHPAVLGMAYRSGKLSGKDFTATLMGLVDQGKVELDTVEREANGKFGRTKRQSEWRLTRAHGPARKSAYAFAATPDGEMIDDAAMGFLFETIAPHEDLDDALRGAYGEPYVLSSFFKDVARKAKSEYAEGYGRWSGAVRASYGSLGLTRAVSSSELYPGVLGLADFALAVIFGFAGSLLESNMDLLSLGIVLLFAAGIYCVMVNDEGPRIVPTKKGRELKAKLKALRRWLLHFTQLDEAIPTDVALWNRLLIMATVLGVADKVIKQLKVHAPEILEDTDLDAMEWYDEGLGKSSAASALAGVPVGVVAARARSGSHHSTSSSSLSSSRSSSSRGSGGGFSSGGGGGFSGGGGRGGAF